MKYPNHMTAAEAEKLELDVVSDDLRIHLTRMLRANVQDRNVDIQLIRLNNIVNRSRTIAGKTIYVLKADEDGNYYPQENAWHNGEMELVFRRLSTPELAEFLAELTQDEYMDEDEINPLLEKDGTSFRLRRISKFERDTISIEVLSIEDLEESGTDEDQHPNIRVLVARMDRALEDDDFAGVLHASASIFETLAKIVVARPTVENQTLKAFFERYRKDSRLPDEILDYILSVYDERNTTPLAGHGSTTPPDMDKDEATILSEMTKAFVRIEYRLSVEKD
jgi:hypothetical protein